MTALKISLLSPIYNIQYMEYRNHFFFRFCISSKETAPSRMSLRPFSMQMTIVELFPPGVGPPSIIKSMFVPSCASTSDGFAAGGFPEKLALVAVTGPPQACNRDMAIEFDEIRIPTVGVFPVRSGWRLESD